ncbi:hypothetical protein [Candidatus Accumulibacter sp. ACC003]|uniref:hypothetical protein n=1 Tax=Candidatus Accumulibacter sp. ACC003 TaxID=2823334 RepID=UPI0025B90A1C|nr:hypothetical protein [Candidatus Accumulibacter sp. ACC003]
MRNPAKPPGLINRQTCHDAPGTSPPGAPPPLPGILPLATAPLDESLVDPVMTIKKRVGNSREEQRITGKLDRIVVTPSTA